MGGLTRGMCVRTLPTTTVLAVVVQGALLLPRGTLPKNTVSAHTLFALQCCSVAGRAANHNVCHASRQAVCVWHFCRRTVCVVPAKSRMCETVMRSCIECPGGWSASIRVAHVPTRLELWAVLQLPMGAWPVHQVARCIEACGQAEQFGC